MQSPPIETTLLSFKNGVMALDCELVPLVFKITVASYQIEALV